jgi:hypothetical protein
MAKEQPTSSPHGPDFYLGTQWDPDPALKMPDPLVPMPAPETDAGDREARRALGYGYSDYV